MSYLVEDSTGNILSHGAHEVEAIEEAKRLLADDPELGELIVAEWREVATVTHGPDADWQSQVVVLRPGETIDPPDNSWKMPPRMCDEEFNAYVSDVYAGEWAKAEGMRQMRDDGLDFPGWSVKA